MDPTLQKLMASARERLEASGCSLVIVRAMGGMLQEYNSRGVLDLFLLYTQDPEVLQGAVIADKVVGKGAAALMALGGIEALTTPVISHGALSLLSDSGIIVEADSVVPNIINRAGNGICPVEALCADAVTPSECLPKIASFLKDRSLIK